MVRAPLMMLSFAFALEFASHVRPIGGRHRSLIIEIGVGMTVAAVIMIIFFSLARRR